MTLTLPEAIRTYLRGIDRRFPPPRLALRLRGVRWARVRHVTGRGLVLVVALLVLAPVGDRGVAYDLLTEARSKAQRPVQAAQARVQDNAARFAAVLAACARGTGFGVADTEGATFVTCLPLRVETERP